MALADLPDLVIARLKTECALFSERVGGVALAERAADQAQFPVPYAFFEQGDITEGEPMLSPFAQEMLVEFSIVVTVASTDRRGQDGTTRFAEAAASVMAALVGWQPATDFSPIMATGTDGEPGQDGARYQRGIKFRTNILSSDL